MLGVALILGFVGGDFQPVVNIFERLVFFIRSNRLDLGIISVIQRAINHDYPVFGIILGVMLLVGTIVFNIFVVNNLRIGSKSFYLKSVRGEGVVFDRLFKNFRDGTWRTQGPKLFRVDIEIFFFTLLLIVPGIIKAYQYYWVPYLLAEDPSLSAEEALRMSKAMTENKKLDIFITEVSFFGWYLLAGFLFSIITVPIVDTYRECTLATYYGMIGRENTANRYSNVEPI